MHPSAEALLTQCPRHATGALVIDLEALRRNYRKLRSMAQPAETAAVVKADAYGTGALHVIPALEKEGCRTFFVATLAEAEVARNTSGQADIYVLDGLLPGTAAAFKAIEARPVLGSLAEIKEWGAFCRSENVRLPAAIHLDTGMTRLGLAAGEQAQLLVESELLASFDLTLVMSHLACADQPVHPKNQAQLGEFRSASAAFPGTAKSLANSAGLFLGPSFHFDLARPGIALYGGRAAQSGANPMEPVVYLYGRVAQIRWAEPCETVGYGAAQTLKRRTQIATVSVGYADGFFRALSASDAREGPSGYVGDYRLPMLGRVSMDLTTFDATDVPEGFLQRGGFIELLGERVTVDELAQYAGTIGYEVLTALGRRYYRSYIGA
jgi:alanine racemase